MHVNVETQMLLVSERTMSPTGLCSYEFTLATVVTFSLMQRQQQHMTKNYSFT